MCYFNTIILPKTTDRDQLRAIAGKFDYELVEAPTSNEESAGMFGDVYFVEDATNCSCDSFLGSKYDYPAPRDQRTMVDRLLARFDKEKRSRHEAQTREQATAIKQQALTEGAKFIQLVSELSSISPSGKVDIIRHYSGEVAIQSTETVTLAELNHDYLADMEENVLYSVFPDAG